MLTAQGAVMMGVRMAGLGSSCQETKNDKPDAQLSRTPHLSVITRMPKGPLPPG